MDGDRFDTSNTNESGQRNARHQAAITKASGPLLERGLLDKQPDPEDCRSFKLVLSEAGEKAVEDLGPEYLGNLERLYNELGEKKYLKLIKLLSQATGVTVKE